ncbi:MAG: hypothetical protein OES34_09760 [Nitrosopumilus sp.]|nr:hypothetical protein [Nitrosopumilus sp.]
MYQTTIKSVHWTDEAGNPAGGTTSGTGFTVAWQHGPLGRGDERQEPNGAFVEDLIYAAIDRLSFYQDSEFACDENAGAILSLEDALVLLRARTADREKREVDGTHAQ